MKVGANVQGKEPATGHTLTGRLMSVKDQVGTMMRPGSEVTWTDFASGAVLAGTVVAIKGVTPAPPPSSSDCPTTKGPTCR